ncbi:hypothetical protein ACIHCQ_18225 [Streptomyces sp. NPDC052236]|uniref:hypothetical protein n=1 Tax=Streptomyces sp. NPDC052236 TaxID=3365686 RepID=UPI0037CF093A
MSAGSLPREYRGNPGQRTGVYAVAGLRGMLALFVVVPVVTFVLTWLGSYLRNRDG